MSATLMGLGLTQSDRKRHFGYALHRQVEVLFNLFCTYAAN